MRIIDTEKYLVFKRKDFDTVTKGNAHRISAALILDELEGIELRDAVVIRRQDKFASPCLLTYAAMISMVAEHHPEQIQKEELQAIADYFHEQGILAGEEGWKLPTL